MKYKMCVELTLELSFYYLKTTYKNCILLLFLLDIFSSRMHEI